MRERIRLLLDLRTSETLDICLKDLDIPSSSYYYALAHPLKELQEQEKYRGLRKKIEKIIRKNPGYGYRRIKSALKKEKIVINAKPLKKLLKLWNLKHIRQIKTPQPSPLASYIKELGAKVNLVAIVPTDRPFRIIFTDFTRIVLTFGIFWLILFSDKLSKRIIGWNISTHPDTWNALRAYKMARHYLKRMKIDLSSVIIHQDQDSVFTGYEYAGTLLNDGVTLSFTEEGFKDNPYMESCNGHFKSEYNSLFQEARNLKELKQIIRRCVRNWNHERIHSALNGRSPDEFIHSLFELAKS